MEGALENLIELSAEGARRFFAESLRQKDRAAATAIVIRHFNEQTGDGLLIFSFLSYIK